MAEKLPRTIVALGFVSLFMDLSSEMIHGLLPLFLTGTLGASALLVGLIEGAGEALAQRWSSWCRAIGPTGWGAASL